LWGDSLTVRFDDSEEEEEYDWGDVDEDRNERQYYFH